MGWQADIEANRMAPESMTTMLWVVWLALLGVAAFWSNRTEKRGSIPAGIAFRILFYLSAALLLAPFSGRDYYAQFQFWNPCPALKWILVALTAIGFTLVW